MILYINVKWLQWLVACLTEAVHSCVMEPQGRKSKRTKGCEEDILSGDQREEQKGAPLTEKGEMMD